MNLSRRTGLAAASAMLLARSTQAAETPAVLDATLRPYLGKWNLPAIGAAVLRDGELRGVGAVGTRRVGTDIPVTVHDRFHIGSDTKAMTVLLTALYIEQGKLGWDTPIGDVLSDLPSDTNAAFRRITLTQLMSHTSGLPGDDDAIGMLYVKAGEQDGNLDAQRRWLVAQWAPKPLAGTPGQSWAYSNLGYVVLGSVLERVGGKTWEELLATQVFDALQLRSAGFGPQSSMGRVDAPLPHDIVDGRPIAYLAGPNADNPLVLGPAGTVHLSLLDFAAWANWQVGEGRRGPALVSPATMKRMHSAVIEMPPQPHAATGTPGSIQASHLAYALGWGVATLSYAKTPFVAHSGSNGKNYAMILLQPQTDFAMVMTTNIGGPKADEAFKALGAELYARFMHP